MKLLRAEFKNFRLLRDLELSFSTSKEKPLTVIRAANETGKTTILTAIQWALYGDDALPGKGSEYRLHPIDWDPKKEGRVPIVVTVDFEVTTRRKGVRGEVREQRQQLRITRSAYEELTGSGWRRSTSEPALSEITKNGNSPIDGAQARIADELPPELREVFFTDGDRALSFIEADVAASTKRARVEKAIRALLGLTVLENSIKHVNRSASEVNREASALVNDKELNQAVSRLGTVDDDIAKIDKELQDATDQFGVADQELAHADRKIQAALLQGDKDKLNVEKQRAERDRDSWEQKIETAAKSHGLLFRSQSLARDLLAPLIQRAQGHLQELRDHGKLPNTTVPVLEERLSANVCICGDTLDAHEPDGARRREHIQSSIENSKRSDEIQGIATELYFGSRDLFAEPGASGWISEWHGVMKARDAAEDGYIRAAELVKAVDLQIDAIPDTNIQALREARRVFADQRDKLLRKQSQLESQLRGLKNEKAELAQTRDRLLKQQKKGFRVIADLAVAQDLAAVLVRAYERISGQELEKVSSLMNQIFLEMIGADPDQGAIIQKAEISKEFDILVFGPEGRTLNPDRDLNGASRRALTMSFILALTKVSEVEAPNVIDTPLGMMSGYVKRSVLRKAIEESSQLVLFLTHSEIEGCEEIIDKSAGVIFTLTNPTHYPKMLVNKPKTKVRKVLRCDCTHRKECSVCERKHDAEARA